ncbi:hypothetical protein CIL05_19435 [Virgibacillus profundi]|uniref:General stress protein n=1 Tax=Virgibacillus profundi TaxID=2024555 RepID=A0A2A2I960_9BACI|nr:DUF948 domain-containing protein [Virgibacillus profundi]PAV27856.1 hypothetical protein CIL05_19435 [Virgibacillus profundi]PXY52034.1 DUF948 domain-containing protein [Virgibacillus profundi]
MDWLGIGVLVIGVALLVLVILLIKPLNKLAGVFANLQKTTDELPQTVVDVTSQAKEAIGAGTDTLKQINTQLKELSPLFYIVGDVGRATNQMSSSMVDAVTKMESKTTAANDLTHRKNLEGLYGALTLGFFIFQKSRELAKERNVIDVN